MTDLAPEAYAQSDYFQREKRSLFAREWLCFGAAGQLAAAGDFVNHTLGGWPVFAVRGADGAVRGFRNICRHQGMPVLDKPTGQCSEIRCRFHGWTYDLSGRLIKAPDQYPPPQPMEQIGLDAFELVEGDGLLFGRLEPGTADRPTPVALGAGRYEAAVTTDVDANWKSVVSSLLAEPARLFVWPNVFMFDRGEVRVARQIVPRTFSRTRLIDLLFTSGAAPAIAAIESEAQADKKKAEALQAQLAAGAPGPDAPQCREFRRRVEADCAAADAATT